MPAQLDAQTSREGLFTQLVKWSRERPGCRGECPTLTVDSLAFPGHPRLTALIDHALAAMTWVDTQRAAPYDTLDGFEAYYWKTAGARDEVRIASFPASELDTSPRATETTANGKKGASVRTQVEIAWALALVLLALGALELAVRALHKPEGAAHPR